MSHPRDASRGRRRKKDTKSVEPPMSSPQRKHHKKPRKVIKSKNKINKEIDLANQTDQDKSRHHFLSVPSTVPANDSKVLRYQLHGAQDMGKSVTSERNYDYHDKFNYWMAGISRAKQASKEEQRIKQELNAKKKKCKKEANEKYIYGNQYGVESEAYDDDEDDDDVDNDEDVNETYKDIIGLHRNTKNRNQKNDEVFMEKRGRDLSPKHLRSGATNNHQRTQRKPPPTPPGSPLLRNGFTLNEQCMDTTNCFTSEDIIQQQQQQQQDSDRQQQQQQQQQTLQQQQQTLQQQQQNQIDRDEMFKQFNVQQSDLMPASFMNRRFQNTAFPCYPGGADVNGGDLGPSQVGTGDGTVTMVNNDTHGDSVCLATAQQNAMINGGHGLSPLQQIWCQQFADANRRQIEQSKKRERQQENKMRQLIQRNQLRIIQQREQQIQSQQRANEVAFNKRRLEERRLRIKGSQYPHQNVQLDAFVRDQISRKSDATLFNVRANRMHHHQQMPWHNPVSGNQHVSSYPNWRVNKNEFSKVDSDTMYDYNMDDDDVYTGAYTYQTYARNARKRISSAFSNRKYQVALAVSLVIVLMALVMFFSFKGNSGNNAVVVAPTTASEPLVEYIAMVKVKPEILSKYKDSKDKDSSELRRSFCEAMNSIFGRTMQYCDIIKIRPEISTLTSSLHLRNHGLDSRLRSLVRIASPNSNVPEITSSQNPNLLQMLLQHSSSSYPILLGSSIYLPFIKVAD